jgi:hypothetical protein
MVPEPRQSTPAASVTQHPGRISANHSLIGRTRQVKNQIVGLCVYARAPGKGIAFRRTPLYSSCVPMFGGSHNESGLMTLGLLLLLDLLLPLPGNES